MRAVEVAELGGPEVLVAREAPDPVAGPGQAVVRVSVAHVLFVETQIRSGWGREYFTVEPPYVPGDGVAGQVMRSATVSSLAGLGGAWSPGPANAARTPSRPWLRRRD